MNSNNTERSSRTTKQTQQKPKIFLYSTILEIIKYIDNLNSLPSEEALDRTLWRTRFGRVYGPVVRQTTDE
jgi:hypothetical protein